MVGTYLALQLERHAGQLNLLPLPSTLPDDIKRL